MPHIDNRISLGNIISLVGTVITAIVLIITLAVWSGRQGQRIDATEKSFMANQATLAGHESRIRAMEQSSARQDERLLLILDSLRKIEARLEREPRP